MTIVTPAGGTATVAQGVATTLQIKYSGATLPIPDGTSIQWTVESEPSSGAGQFTPENSSPPSYSVTQTTTGFASVAFTGNAPGTYELEAAYCPDACDDSASSTITVPATSADVSITTATALILFLRIQPDLHDQRGKRRAISQPGGACRYPDSSVTFVSLAAPAGWACSTPAIAPRSGRCSTASMASATRYSRGWQVSPTVLQGSASATGQHQRTTADSTPAIIPPPRPRRSYRPLTLGLGSGDGQTKHSTRVPAAVTVVAGGRLSRWTSRHARAHAGSPSTGGHFRRRRRCTDSVTTALASRAW